MEAQVPCRKRRCRPSKKKRQRQKKHASVDLKDNEKNETQAHGDQVSDHQKIKDGVEMQRPPQEHIEVLQSSYNSKSKDVQDPIHNRKERDRSREHEHNDNKEERSLEDERKRRAKSLIQASHGNEFKSTRPSFVKAKSLSCSYNLSLPVQQQPNPTDQVDDLEFRKLETGQTKQQSLNRQQEPERTESSAGEENTVTSQSHDHDDDGLDGNAMSEYERKRRDTILRNQTFLLQVGMSTARAVIRGDAEAKAKKEALALMRAQRAAHYAELPKRKSQRLSEEPKPVLTRSVELGHPLDVLSVKQMRQPLGSKLYVMDANDEEGEKFCQEIAGGVDVVQDSSTVDLDDSTTYSLADKDITKALPYLTTTMAFLPRVDRVVVAAGDKEGHIALWSPSTDTSSSMAALSRPHGFPVSQLLFPDPSTLLSSSIDGTHQDWNVDKAPSSVGPTEDKSVCDRMR
ncbi:uncharacterized protein PITG_08830 [Phytophthora infestans T30-4]|uniref:WD domain-containing protein n=1 Tax=Phytophthora infestans (strain T30-4) TaxID=403677 RepID=D0NDA3_PHYIT|nr:uncharacterized protein PITG_08830 [Phytophthora infestans T30-4]EEY56060.1 conserved hypothetical protein [Phytophthora infestans T30-4]|eukprot:XP_002902890.1 conserved hypothetical protein [Phytophthora infestans T30-4]